MKLKPQNGESKERTGPKDQSIRWTLQRAGREFQCDDVALANKLRAGIRKLMEGKK